MYVGADDGKLYALNLDGTIRWSFPTGGSVRTTPLVAADGTIYFGSFDGNFYAVDASGVERWRQPTGAGGFFRFSSPILDPATGYVVVGASDGVLRAFDAATGDPVWGSPAAGPIYASPVAVGGKVLFGSNDGRVRVLDSATGDLLDVIDIGAAVQSSPAVDVPFGRLFVGAEDGSVRAFDLATGDLLWTTPTGGTVTSSPALDLSRGRIYVGSDDHSLYALDVTTGAVAWQHPTGEAVRSSPTVDAAGNIYVGSCDGNVYGFDASGVLLFTFFSSGLIIPSPTLGTDGLLYIGSDDHYLYAIGPDPFGGVPLRAARVDQVEPAGAIQGETIEVAVRGADLGEGIELAFGAGVRVLERYAVSSREVRARLAIEPAAALGPRDVVVSSREGLPSTQVRGFEIGFDCRRADLSGDGSVDGIDLALLASRFGGRSAAGDMGDLDGSSGVDGIDLALLAARFGAGASCR
jgi:outer membrane protein assembly factor BamB